ncbi:hypothetical protein OYC64_011409 [Pagothenia borchgrevinki]|uniref:Cystatin-B n=1 Tax=Pagothenia borchgrevinki TaxID=8213 RepID=A0ABD2FF69_PAGBO
MADMVMCGGWGETKDATEETQEICDAVKDQVEQRTNQKYAVYKAVKFRFAVAAGRDLTIKVFAGEEDYIHLSVFYHLPCNGGKVELLNVEEGKTKHDPLGPFLNVDMTFFNSVRLKGSSLILKCSSSLSWND